jgi:hypothetical protein
MVNYEIMDDYEDIRVKLKAFTKAPIQVHVATVLRVDESDYTCEVQFLSGSTKSDVRLKAAIDELPDGVVEIPEDNSTVLVGIIGNKSSQCFVLKCSKVKRFECIIKNVELRISSDGIVMNGGDLGGMVKIKELEANLKSLKTYCENLKTAIGTGFTAVGASMAANGALGKKAFDSAINNAIINFEDMENEKVKH